MLDNVNDAGAVEARFRPLRETGTVPSGMSTSGKLVSQGLYDFFVPVAASETTVTVAMRYDATYAGDLPRILTKYIPGDVAQEVDTMEEAADTWEDLVVTFTPTASGIAWIRVESRSTAAAGITYFGNIRRS